MTVYDFIKTNFAQHFQKYDRAWVFFPNGTTAISHQPNLMLFYYVITIIECNEMLLL
jgi:hypothetical protein